MDVSSSHNGDQPSQSPTSTDLCERCASMFSTVESLRALVSEDGIECFEWSDIRHSASRGCPLCLEIKEQRIDWILHSGPRFRKDSRLKIVGVDKFSDSDPVGSSDYPHRVLSIRYVAILAYNMSENLFAIYTPQVDMTTKYLHNCISFPSDLLDDKHVKEVKRRLVECQDNHETCSRQEPPSLPVRVVDVGSTDADIKLHISETDEKASYIALSYCWGGAQQIRTTMDTLETKMGGIPFTHLSRTIKDAIKVTRKLGIQYLWVDALCIIQDSQDDKASQITNMGKIYRNATLTIAVSGAESAQTGFLDATPTYRGFELPFLLPGGIQGHVVATPCSYSYHKPDWPLSTRAWTLQECVLSPRLLSFSDGEVRWRCQSVDLLPLFCSPFNYGPNYMPPRFPLGVTDNVAGVSHSTDVDSSVQRERDRETRLIQDQFWGNIVVDFSRRRATLREDRLPALAGIADQLEVVWKDTYLAGVWKSRLVGNLAWIASNAKIPSQTDPYLAPSWSWLSIEDSEIVFNLMESTDAEVLACSAEPLYHSARLGQLKGGTLILRAAVASAPIEVVELLDHGDTYKPLIDQQGLYMNLGFDILGMGVGLILIPKAEGVFTRAGYFCWKSGDPPYHIYHDFSTVERRVVTII